jgi:hypothetical protein
VVVRVHGHVNEKYEIFIDKTKQKKIKIISLQKEFSFS